MSELKDEKELMTIYYKNFKIMESVCGEFYVGLENNDVWHKVKTIDDAKFYINTWRDLAHKMVMKSLEA